MLERTIKQVVRKKVDDWLSTVPDDLEKVIRDNLIITGGCFTSMMQNETPHDYDCYFRTKEAVLAVANYYVDKWNEKHKGQKNKLGKACECMVLDGENPSQQLLDYYKIKELKKSESRMIANCPSDRVKIIFPSDGVTGDPEAARASEELGTAPEVIGELDEVSAEDILNQEKERYAPVFMSTNAITLSNSIQLIVRFYGNPDEIHDTFDFRHAQAYWRSDTGELSIPAEVYECVMNKTLIYTGSKYPVCSMFRLRKFIERGWKVNAGQMLKIAMQISDLDLHNIDVLEDQLVGVDSLYFLALIRRFEEVQKNKEGFELTTDYVVSVIDKIFG